METPTKLLNLQQDGIIIAKEFIQERLLLSSKTFLGPIPRSINKSMVKKKYIIKKNSLTMAEVNRDVLGDLLCLTTKSIQVIDFKKALKYSLLPIRLSLSFPDGTKGSPTKSSLMEIIGYNQVMEDDAYVGHIL